VVSALVLLIYAGLAGPLGFYLAARKGRPLRALWQLPIWSACTLLVIVLLGLAGKGVSGRARRLSLFDAGAGMTRAAAVRFRGFYAASSRELTVRAGRREHVLDIAGLSSEIPRTVVVDRDGPRLEGLRTKPWQTVLIREEGTGELSGGISVLPVDNDFVIKNRAARDLVGVVVRLPSGRFTSVPTAPNVSANAMYAPPCRMPPAVHRSGRTTISASTRSGASSVMRTPIEPGNSGSSNCCIASREIIVAPWLSSLR
jgi:hypothetical protein